MIELESWLKAYADRMEAAFGERLVLLGLQGSYRRGEATEESDIDLVAVLNRVDVEELRQYRALIREMPEGEKACGFIAGQEELRNRPRWDLYQLAGDMRVLRGRAEAVFPAFTAADARQAAREGAAALYHVAAYASVRGGFGGGAGGAVQRGCFSCCGRAHDARAGIPGGFPQGSAAPAGGGRPGNPGRLHRAKGLSRCGSGGAGRGISGAYPLVRENPQRVRRGRCIRVKKGVYWQVELHGFLDF